MHNRLRDCFGLVIVMLLVMAVAAAAQTPTPPAQLPPGLTTSMGASSHGASWTGTANLPSSPNPPPGYTFDCARGVVWVKMFCYDENDEKICEVKIQPKGPDNPGGYTVSCSSYSFSVTCTIPATKCHPSAAYCRMAFTCKVQKPNGDTHNPYPQLHGPSF